MVAVVADKVVVSLEAKIARYLRNVRQAQTTFDRRMQKIERRAIATNARVARSFTALSGTLGVAFGAAGLAALTRGVSGYSDAWTQAGNKIAAASEVSGKQARSLSDLNDLAGESRSEFGATVDLYSKLLRSTKDITKSEKDVAKATDIVAKSFKAGGSAASEQAAGILQLGQALGSSQLSGDELRSIRENAPLLAQAIADEFSTTIGGLKELGAEGKLTSDRVFKAILKAEKQIEAAFQRTNSTIEDSFVRLRNSLTEYIGSMAQSIGLTETVNELMNSLSDNIDDVAKGAALLGIGLAAAFAPAIVGGIVAGAGALIAAAGPIGLIAGTLAASVGAVALFSDEVQAVAGHIATLEDVGVVIWQDIANAASVAAAGLGSAFDSAVSLIEASLAGVNLSFEDLAAVVKNVANRVIGSLVFAKDAIVVAFSTLPGAIAEAVVSAMNGMIAAVESGLRSVIAKTNQAIEGLNSVSEAFGGPTISAVPEISLPRIKNEFKGAGAAAGKSFADAAKNANRDFIGEGAQKLEDEFNTIIDRADKRRRDINARNRIIAINEKANEDAEATKTPPKRPPPRTAPPRIRGGSGRGGGGGGGAGLNGFQQEIDAIRDRTKALELEASVIGLSTRGAEKARAAHALLTAAKKAGIPITDELKAKIDELATAYGNAAGNIEEAKQSQEAFQETMAAFADASREAFGTFVNDLRAGKSASEALENALKQLEGRLIDLALDGIFSGLQGALTGGGGSGLFSLFGFKEGGKAFADGGEVNQSSGARRRPQVPAGSFVVNAKSAERHKATLSALSRGKAVEVRGPGTGRSDSIVADGPGGKPIRLSNREIVVPPEIYRNNPALIEGINNDRIPSRALEFLMGDQQVALASGGEVNVPMFADGGAVSNIVANQIGNVNPVARPSSSGGGKGIVADLVRAISENPPQVQLRNINSFDPDEVVSQAIDGPLTEKALINMVRRNPGKFRGALGV